MNLISILTMNIIAVTVLGTCLTCLLVLKGARLKLTPHYLIIILSVIIIIILSVIIDA